VRFRPATPVTSPSPASSPVPAHLVRLGQVVSFGGGEVYLLSYAQTEPGPQLSLFVRSTRQDGPSGPEAESLEQFTAQPARDLPEPWLSMLAHYHGGQAWKPASVPPPGHGLPGLPFKAGPPIKGLDDPLRRRALTPLHFQSIGHRGACRKTRVMTQNGWPGTELTGDRSGGNGSHQVRVLLSMCDAIGRERLAISRARVMP